VRLCPRPGSVMEEFMSDSAAPKRLIHVIKLGGSLLDLPELIDRFDTYCLQRLKGAGLLVVGGGKAADLIRHFHQLHPLELSVGHDLCVRAMQLNTHMLVTKLEGGVIVTRPGQCEDVWKQGKLVVVDPYLWLEHEQREHRIVIPRKWQFTSDSIAAHLAVRLSAERLTLLKSTLAKGPCDLAAASELKLVDGEFADTASSIPAVEIVNLRDPQLPGCVLQSL